MVTHVRDKHAEPSIGHRYKTPVTAALNGLIRGVAGAAGQSLTDQDPVGNWMIQLEDTDELAASFQVWLHPGHRARLHRRRHHARMAREQAVVFIGADAASRFQRRSSAASALFLILGHGDGDRPEPEMARFIDVHGGLPVYRSTGVAAGSRTGGTQVSFK